MEEETYNEKIRKEYAKNTRTMKITMFNLGLAAVLFTFFGFLNIFRDDAIGYAELALTVYTIVLMFFYWRRNITARNFVIFSSAFGLFFINMISMMYMHGFALLAYGFIEGLVSLILSVWILYAIVYNSVANLVNEDTRQKFEYPDILPRDT